MKVAIFIALCMIAIVAAKPSSGNERDIKPLLARKRELRDAKSGEKGSKIKKKKRKNYCERCKNCAFYKKSSKTEKWMKRNRNINQIYKKLSSRFNKAYLFNKNSLMIKKNPCSPRTTEVQISLGRCEKTISSICNISEFREVNKFALKCVKQKNCKWIPKYCNLYKEKDFDRIKTKWEECLDETLRESYSFCMRIVMEEVPTMIEYCKSHESHDY